jgi:alginate O-acetyltransferase complex protein AlgJ
MDATHATASAPPTVSHGGGPTDPSHDARLRLGILDTAIARPVAISLIVLFLALIYGIPVSQAVLEKLDDDDSTLLPLFTRKPTKENLRTFEKEIEQASYAKDYVQPRVQLWLSRLGRVGNKRALVGRNGFLYYTPGLTHLAGPNFIDKDVIASREREARESEDGTKLQADPRLAIYALHDLLTQRGIRLVVFPMPDKTMLQPLQLHGRGNPQRPLPVAHNVGFHEFAAELRAHGVSLFDPAPEQLAPGEPPRYLVQDTHWTPTWMRKVAGDLAGFVTRVAALPPVAMTKKFHAVPMQVERVGDIVDMLKLPDDQAYFRPQTETVYQVQDETGAQWEADPAGDVLLLGDSFTNVYSLDTMGWGEGAGLAPTLALALGRGVDVIAQNDSGAYATRQALSRELAAGEDRLAGKRVVIWEFASRELSVGDWKSIDWTSVPSASQGAK